MSDFAFAVDVSKVEHVLRGMPKIAYYHTRAYLKGILIEHRLAWLKGKSTQFGRGGANSKAIKVHRVGESAGATQKSVLYDIPEKERAASSEEATKLFAAMTAAIHTGNLILPTHEFGVLLRPKRSKYMAINVKGTLPRNIEEWKAAHGRSRMVVRPSRDPGKLLAFEVGLKKRSRGSKKLIGPGVMQAHTIGPSRVSERWKLRFVLVRQTKIQAELKFYDTWDRLKGLRESKWRERVDRMIADFKKGDPRDR